LISYNPYFHIYSYILIIVGFVSLIIVIETLPIQLTSSLPHIKIISNVLAQQQSVSTNTSIVNDSLEQQNNQSKTVKAFGHFANNQIKDGIVTWIQGGYWNLTISNIINDDSNSLNNNNIVINNDSNSRSKADFTANFTMIKPDGSLSHNHNIKNFISDKVILADKDIVLMGTADVYSDNDIINKYKNIPLTIHLMGKKVLGLTIDVRKTEGHFASPNEMFGTLISGVGLDTSAAAAAAAAIDNSNQKTMMHHDTATNDTIKEDSMAMMQH
jgi:hypothetical protein